MSSFETRLTKLWRIEKPIVCAPMAGRAGGQLARAVSLAGGMGMFGVGANTSPDWISEQAAIAREGGVFGIGLMLWAMEKDPELGKAQWEAVLAARPTVVSLGFGDSTVYVEEAHERGISVVQPANTIAQLKAALAAGADAITIQGTDAGGHTGRLGTMPWMQIALDYMETHAPAIPVAIAGGIGSGRGVASVLAAGADAAWIGTAFLGSPEALGGEELQQAAIEAKSVDTVLTDIYDIAEQQAWDTQTWPTRTVRNEFVDAYAQRRDRGEVTEDELISARAAGGEFESALKLHAGQGVDLVRSKMSAEKIVDKLHTDAMYLLGRVHTNISE